MIEIDLCCLLIYVGVGHLLVVRSRAEGKVSWPVGCDFFVTEKGFIEIGPQTLVPGDQVCTLFRGDVPLILRTTKEDFTRSSILGEASVHGVTDGELWKDEPDEDGYLVPADENLHKEEIILIQDKS